MTRLQLWQQFLQKQETTSADVFVLAAVAVLFWWLLTRGRRHERWTNLLAVVLFWVVAIALGVLGW